MTPARNRPGPIYPREVFPVHQNGSGLPRSNTTTGFWFIGNSDYYTRENGGAKRRLSLKRRIVVTAIWGSPPITRTFLKRLKAPNHSSQLDVSSADCESVQCN